MTQKKPIWTTVEAHAHLKKYCASVGRTQLEVVSELIMTQLGGGATTSAGTDEPAETPVEKETVEADAASESKTSENQHFGGVWVV